MQGYELPGNFIAGSTTIHLMDRRTCLKAMAAMTAGGMMPTNAAGKPIQLHVDLEVAPGREEEMVKNFHTVFEPVISKQPGFSSVTLLKLRQEIVGKNPTPASYLLVISFQTEEQRVAWVATDDHQRVWPAIEKTLTGMKFNAMLYDPV